MKLDLRRSEASAITEVVREFILTNFMPGDPPASLRDDDLLLEGGIVDSAGVVSLVALLEERFSIRILDEELFPENFATVERIAEFIAGKLRS